MKLKLLEKKQEAKGTFSFFFEPEKEIKWLPGQYYYYTIPKLKFPDDRGTTRHFTISSSPTEGSILRLTTRIREESGYKKTLDSLPIGTELEGAGPNGTFVVDEKLTGPQVFLAGGIGITPFRSIIKYAVDRKLTTPIYLIYSNSIPEEIAFHKELEEYASKNSNIKVEFTVSKPEESSQKWSGRKGRIDANMIGEILSEWKLKKTDVNWWLSGPPAMIDALEDILEKMDISWDKIMSEKFTGY